MPEPSEPSEMPETVEALRAPGSPDGPEAPGSPSRRVPRRLRKPGHLAAIAVFAVAGLLFAASAVTAKGTDLRAERSVELRDLARREADRVAQVDDAVRSVQSDIDVLLEQAQGGTLDRSRQRVDALAPAAGATEVSGPGLTVTLDDAPAAEPGETIPGNPSPDDLVVHQQDVQAVVNALWRGGATAVRIMDQRIISTSAVRCVGNTLILQGRVYSPPFVITAVGNVAAMQEALDIDPLVLTYRDYVLLFGLGYEETVEDSVTLPAYTGPLAPRYATPAP